MENQIKYPVNFGKYKGSTIKRVALIDYPYFDWMLENCKDLMSKGSYFNSFRLKDRMNNFVSQKKVDGKPAVKISVPCTEGDYVFEDFIYIAKGDYDYRFTGNRVTSPASFKLRFDELLGSIFNKGRHSKKYKELFTEILIESATGSKVKLDSIDDALAKSLISKIVLKEDKKGQLYML